MANQRTWTDNQLSAITARGGSVIVSAAAGSGKTSVLVERVIRMITDPVPAARVDVDRLLIVTYTRAAAAELRTRLSNALSDCIRENPTDAGLVRQQALLGKASISTVDSFCSSLAREYFYELDIDRKYRIGDSGELAVLRADAMRLTLDTMYAEGDKNFFVLVETFASSKSDTALEENINRLYDFIMSHPFPNRWLDEKLAYFDSFTDASTSVWGRIISDYTDDAIDYMESLYERGYNAISLEEEIYKKARGLYESDRIFLYRLKDAVSRSCWDDIRAALSSFVPGRFVLRGYTDHPLKREASAARDAFKAVVKNLQKLYAQDESMCLYDIELLKDYAAQLFKAVRLFRENYSALKRDRNLADYPDLEHWAVELLVDEDTMQRTPLAEEISRRFSEIMVDEFQDANETQDVIFRALSDHDSNLFVVGDVKQSIYGFRHAMPELFIKRKNNSVLYHPENPAFPAKIILEQNFRSEKTLLSAVNYFFMKLMSPSVGDIEYNDEEKLYPGLDYEAPVSPPIELNVLDKEGMGESDSAVCEAQFIAERIHRLIASGYPVLDGGVYRPVCCGDIAVLMRNMTKAPKYIETLNLCGLRTHSKSGDSFLDSLEIMLISNMLRVISNPALDIPLLSVMMSPVFGFDANDLARMRSAKQSGSLYAALTLDAKSGNRRSAAFVEELRYYRELSVTLPLSKLINTIYERSSFMAVISALDSASSARNNLRVFLDYARSFEQNTHRGLSAFINYIDRLVESRSDLQAAASEDNAGDDAVTVMSMHSSKGLEFPVVILADLNHGFISDTSEKVLLHPKYGYVQKRFDAANSVSYNTMPYEALSLEIKRSEMSEELRILYVALTRARQKLIAVTTPTYGAKTYLSGIAKKLSGQRDLTPYVVRSANSMADWMTMCAMIHPDGVPLRELIDAEVDAEPTADFGFDCRVVDTPLYADDDDVEIAEQTDDTHIGLNESILDELRRHATFVYPYDSLQNIPVKVAASALAHKQSVRSGERYLARPAFMSGEKLTGAEKGTALHAFMQFADFAAARKDIGAELSRLTQSGFITDLQAQSIDLDHAQRFIDSPLVTRCLNAEQVYKEYRFTIRIPAAKVSEEIDDSLRDETVILQGAVDLAFVENGKLVIVDYKTDRVKRPEQLREMYAIQLMLYKDALTQCLKLPVKECTIYSVRHSAEVEVYTE